MYRDVYIIISIPRLHKDVHDFDKRGVECINHQFELIKLHVFCRGRPSNTTLDLGKVRYVILLL